MDPIEESVRRALEGGNPADHSFRRSIYAASFRAMERMIERRGLGAEAAEDERGRVTDILDRVEAEYFAYYGGDAGPAAEATEGVRASDPVSAASGPAGSGEASKRDSRLPETPRGSADAPQAAARGPASFTAPPAGASAKADGGEVWRPGTGARPDKRRRLGRSAMLGLLFLVILAVLLAVAVSLLTPGDRTTATEAAAVSDSATPGGPIAWIDAFAGTSLEQVSTPAGGRVASVEGAARPAIRISGPEGGEGEILIDLGPGLVSQIAGRNVRMELVAGSADGEPREFSVRCLFQGESACARQRFVTSMPEEAFVFDVDIPDNAQAPASLALGPGLSPGAADVDIYSLRMRIL